MKQIKLYLSGIFLLGIIVVACKKNATPPIGAAANKAAEHTKQLSWRPAISPVAIDPNDPIEIQQLEQFAGYDFSGTPAPNNEYDASVLVTPLMANSIQYFHDMGLSNSDMLDVFSSMSDYKIAYVAFAMQRLDLENGASIGCNSSNLAIRCLISSLLPCEIMDLFTGVIREKLVEFGFTVAFNSLSMSAKKVLLKAIGARVSGFIGGGGALALTFFIIDFTTCMVHGTDTPSPTPVTGHRYLNPLDQLSYQLPIISYPVTLDYISNETNFISGIFSIATSSDVYFNSSDGKYYSDSAFTTYVPDGFYDVQISLILPVYYRIIDGEAIMAFELHQ